MSKPPGERPRSVPDRVSLQLPKASGAASGKYPRCASCGLFITIGPHGSQQDCIDALTREVAALKRTIAPARNLRVPDWTWLASRSS